MQEMWDPSPARLGKVPWRRKCQPTPVFLPGESHRQKSLMGYSPRGHKELDVIQGPNKAGNLKQLIRYIVLCSIDDCNSATLDMGKCHKGKHFLDHNRLVRQNLENLLIYQQVLEKRRTRELEISCVLIKAHTLLSSELRINHLMPKIKKEDHNCRVFIGWTFARNK